MKKIIFSAYFSKKDQSNNSKNGWTYKHNGDNTVDEKKNQKT